jgi:predicted RNA methylase
VSDLQGESINPARKSRQEIEQFLYQFADPKEPQLIFSMLDGLGAVAQAAIHLGNFDVICFEKDRRTWEAAVKIVTNEIEKVRKVKAGTLRKIKQSMDTQRLVMKVQENPEIELDEEEVLFRVAIYCF